MTQKIKVNKAKCKHCKDIIESTHRHDFVHCKCTRIAVDGGKDYLKRVGFPDLIEDLSEFEEDEAGSSADALDKTT